MAKTSLIHKELKRKKRVEQFADRRAALVKVLKDPEASLEEKEAACVLAVCSSMAAGGGDAKAAEGGDAKAAEDDAKAPAGDAKADG